MEPHRFGRDDEMLFLLSPFGLPDPSRGWWPGDEPLGIYNGGPFINRLVCLLFIVVLIRAYRVVRQRRLSRGE